MEISNFISHEFLYVFISLHHKLWEGEEHLVGIRVMEHSLQFQKLVEKGQNTMCDNDSILAEYGQI